MTGVVQHAVEPGTLVPVHASVKPCSDWRPAAAVAGGPVPGSTDWGGGML